MHLINLASNCNRLQTRQILARLDASARFPQNYAAISTG
jgi:hypothetical protein